MTVLVKIISLCCCISRNISYFLQSNITITSYYMRKKLLVIHDGRKDEIFFEMQQHNGVIFTKIGLHKYPNILFKVLDPTNKLLITKFL